MLRSRPTGLVVAMEALDILATQMVIARETVRNICLALMIIDAYVAPCSCMQVILRYRVILFLSPSGAGRGAGGLLIFLLFLMIPDSRVHVLVCARVLDLLYRTMSRLRR